MQDEIAFTEKWTLAVSARADLHSHTVSSPPHGCRCSPAFCRLDGSRSGRYRRVRTNAIHGRDGRNRPSRDCGHFGGLRAERARGASLDVDAPLRRQLR